MHTVVFIEHTGVRHEVQAAPGRSLMQVARDSNVPGILGDCGGSCSCATCHAYLDPAFAAALPEMTEGEHFMLDAVPDRRANSRLCCQIKLVPELDRVVVELPQEQV